MATRPRNRRHPITRRDPRLAELEEAKQVTTDYIGELRRGFVDGWDVKRRADIIRSIVLPKPGGWRGMQDPYTSDSTPPTVHRDRFIFADSIPSTPRRLPPRGQQKLRDAYAATFRLNQKLAPAHATFRKIIGFGGCGVAALFGLQDSTGRETKVVVKADLRSRPGDLIKTEKKNMTLMAGAKHVVQRTLLTEFPWPKTIPESYDYIAALGRIIIKLPIFLVHAVFLVLLTLGQIIVHLIGIEFHWLPEEDAVPERADDPGLAELDHPSGLIPSLASWTWSNLWPDWPAEAPSRQGIDDAIRQSRKDLDDQQDMISMEFLKYGDLSKWISKMARMNLDDPEDVFPEEEAWAIFECLWRGCIALAYPTGFYQGKDPSTTQIPQMTESSENSAVSGGDPMVHFDLDPQNVFIGNIDTDHVLWPITKIGDLGLSTQPKSQVFEDDIDEESIRWRRRTRGKRTSFLPEQITEQWDYIPDLNALRSHEVAGNYGSHSNIYHIGLIMFQIMTLNTPDEPPFARPYDFVIDRQSLSGWTYGHNLLEEHNPELARHYSAELRHTVAWCMEHNPLERPSLNRLDQIIERNTAAHSSEDSSDRPADAHKKSVDNLLRSPLPPRSR